MNEIADLVPAFETSIKVDPTQQNVVLNVSWNSSATTSLSSHSTNSSSTTVALPKEENLNQSKGMKVSSNPNETHLVPDFTKDDNPVSLKPVVVPAPSDTSSRNSGGTSKILPDERKKATFEVSKMITFIDGDEKSTEKRRWIMSTLADTDLSDMQNWDRTTLFAKHIDHFISIHKKFSRYRPTRQEVAWMSEYYALKGSLMNHHGLFLTTLNVLASDEQKKWWFQRALEFKIIGCYAQTELGHGSNVRGLQAVAQFDNSSKEFVLNTPTLQSMKWWPGALGKICTHALVYAQLILNGKEHGIHVFMVQIRDENHRPLPGITVGDLGPKLGDAANDTGFLRLEDVRIPREFMLSAHQYIDENGNYVKSPKKGHDKLHYATMMYTRGMMIAGGAGALAKAATIATRYSCVRKQGFENASRSDISYLSNEVQVIDHQVQRYRIFRGISLTYTLKFTAFWMINKFKDLEAGQGSAATNLITDVSALPEIAASSAGLKAIATFMVGNTIEDLRKCCGGNGYLMSSGIAPLSVDYLWQTTAEGDWVILMLLTARFLMKVLKDAKMGTKLKGPVEYLNVIADENFNILKHAPEQSTNPTKYTNLEYLLQLFKFRALATVGNVGNEFYKLISKGVKYEKAWEQHSNELCNAVRAHCLYFMMTVVSEKVADAKQKDSSVYEVLNQLFCFFALTNIIDDNWGGFLTFQQLSAAKAAANQLMEKLRPNAVALVDSFDIPDNILNSTIGRYDGNIYESLFQAALKTELNQVDPFPGYEKVLRPYLDLDYLRAYNKPPSKM